MVLCGRESGRAEHHAICGAGLLAGSCTGMAVPCPFACSPLGYARHIPTALACGVPVPFHSPFIDLFLLTRVINAKQKKSTQEMNRETNIAPHLLFFLCGAST